jgi:gliding-associated putative ABC transporter substrate-binding component GldG
MNLIQKEKILALLVAAIFVLSAIVLSLFYLRVDVTSNQAYTIGEASRQILAEAEEDIQATYYTSAQLRNASPIPQAVEDLLWEYAGRSGGRFKIRVVDSKEPNAESDLQRMGVRPQEIQVMEQSQLTVALVYSAIRLEYLGREEILPDVYNPDNLEYQLTSALRKLIRQEQRRLGVVIGNKSQSLENNWSVLNEYLKGMGTVVITDSSSPIDLGLTVLLVMGHKDLTEKDAYYIDQFIMHGKPVLLALDGVDVNVNTPTLTTTELYPKPLSLLVENYGVKVEPSLVLDIYTRVLQFQGMRGLELKRYPFWFQIDPRTNINRDHPITRRFAGLDLMWASPLTLQQREGVTAVQLLKSSEKSVELKGAQNVEPDQGMISLQMGQQEAKSHALAYVLTGTLTSGYKPSNAPEGVNTEGFVEKSPETRLVIIGDSDWASDFIRIPVDIFTRADARYNLEFLGSIVEWLSQDEMILKIKSRNLRPRELAGLREEGARNFADFILKLVGLGLVPLGVIIFGVVRLVRRKNRENLIKSLSRSAS